MKRYLIRGTLFAACIGALSGFNYHVDDETATPIQKRSLPPCVKTHFR